MRRASLLALTLAVGLTLPTGGQSIFTYAGGGTNDGRPATAVDLSSRVSVAVDSDGNVYIAEYEVARGGGRVRMVSSATGVISTFAGTGGAGYEGDGGPATRASLTAPEGMTFDSAGNMFLAAGRTIRRIDGATSIITTVAGPGVSEVLGDGGPATEAYLSGASKIAIDRGGNLFFIDGWRRVRRIDGATGIITTVAGNGESESSGDGGPATLAGLRDPTDLAVASTGDLFVVSYSDKTVRRVDASTQIIETLVTCEGQPYAMTIDSADHLVIPHCTRDRIVRLSPLGDVSFVAGNGSHANFCFTGDGVSAGETYVGDIGGLAYGPDGSLFVAAGYREASLYPNRVYEIDAATRLVTTVAGRGGVCSTNGDGFAASDDGGPATAAILKTPWGVTVDREDNIYFSDEAGLRVRKIDRSSGTIVTIAGNGGRTFTVEDGGPATSMSLHSPRGVAVDEGGNVFFVDHFSIRRVDASSGLLRTIAGNGLDGYTGDDGPATAASMEKPRALAVDREGNLYVSNAQTVRRIEAHTGIIRRFAGKAGGFEEDGHHALETVLGFIANAGLALDEIGRLYIADDSNRVRVVDPETGLVRTIAGTGDRGFGGDGAPATGARLGFGLSIAVARDGTVYISDDDNNVTSFGKRVRRVDAETGIIRTIAGTGATGYSGDGGPASASSLSHPFGIAVDSLGSVYFADQSNSRIRMIPACRAVNATSLVSPQSGSTGIATTTSLRWTKVDGALSYDLYLDTADPPERLVAEDVETITFAVPLLEPLTTYYWRVVARGDPYCDPFRSADSAVASFTTTGSCGGPAGIDVPTGKP